MSLTFRSILAWLRAGYPHGVPGEDYIALLGVLQRHLTDDEIVRLVTQLREQRGAEPTSEEEIRRSIEHLLKGHAADEDVRRVSMHLAAAGWPTAPTGSDDTAPTAPSADQQESTCDGGPAPSPGPAPDPR